MQFGETFTSADIFFFYHSIFFSDPMLSSPAPSSFSSSSPSSFYSSDETLSPESIDLIVWPNQ